MSDYLPHKRAMHRSGRLRGLRAEPEVILVEGNKAPVLRFKDNTEGTGTCLGCHDAPCMELAKEEVNVGGTLRTFPGDPSRDVCPTNAIDWDEAGEAPTIDTENCIGCGLCAARCPYGAISLLPEGIARVEARDPDGITIAEPDVANRHFVTSRVGVLGEISMPFPSNLPEVANGLTDIQAARLVRNMLTVCGVIATMRRKGDTNIRMDGVVRFESGQIGVLELETSSAALESPRALLEDIAVLNSRFDIEKSDIVPVSILGTLPNSRSEYYQVIDDIEKVLGIRCRTLTLGALCLFVWHSATIQELKGNFFYASQGAEDIGGSVKHLLGDFTIPEPYVGAFEPPK